MPSSASPHCQCKIQNCLLKTKMRTNNFWNSRWEEFSEKWHCFFLVKHTILTKALREENKRNKIRVLLCLLALFSKQETEDFCTKVGAQSLRLDAHPTMHVYRAIGLNTHTLRTGPSPSTHSLEKSHHRGQRPQATRAPKVQKPQIGGVGRDSLLMRTALCPPGRGSLMFLEWSAKARDLRATEDRVPWGWESSGLDSLIN